MSLPNVDLPLAHLRMADFIYGFDRLSTQSLNVVTPQGGSYQLQHDADTTIRLTIKPSQRAHRQKPGFVAVRGLSVTVVRAPSFVPNFVVTWRNSEKSLLVYVPVNKEEVLHLFPTVPKEERFSIIECPSLAPRVLSHFMALPQGPSVRLQ